MGLSFLVCRYIRMAVDLRNGAAPAPGFLRYLGFCFFAPVMSVGPIHRYAEHQRALDERHYEPAVAICALRALVGAVKFAFLAPLFDQLSYANLLLDGRYHTRLDLLVGSMAYYFFLYLNFSGVCDMALGAAGFLGIPVPENFANPFGARNVKEYWNRWHMTLSLFMRDMVFSPVSRKLVAAWGVARLNEALAVTMMLVFLLIGIWHGKAWNYVLFGLLHGLAMTAVNYYGAFLRRRLTKEQFKAYHENRAVKAAAVGATFLFTCAALLVFANPVEEIHWIFHSLR